MPARNHAATHKNITLKISISETSSVFEKMQKMSQKSLEINIFHSSRVHSDRKSSPLSIPLTANIPITANIPLTEYCFYTIKPWFGCSKFYKTPFKWDFNTAEQSRAHLMMYWVVGQIPQHFLLTTAWYLPISGYVSVHHKVTSPLSLCAGREDVSTVNTPPLHPPCSVVKCLKHSFTHSKIEGF